MALDIGTLAGYLDLDTKAFDDKLDRTEDKARRQGRKSGDAFGREHSKSLKDRLDNNAGSIMSSFGDKLSAAARPVAAAAAAGLASQLVTSLAAGIAAGAVRLAHGFAAGLALLPSVAVAGGLALGTLKLALSGVSDALKAGLSGDTKKFNEALKSLPPSARAVLREVAGLKDQLDGLKATVQENFFKPLVGHVQPLAELYLPVLNREMGDLGRHFGQAVSSTASWLAVPEIADQIAKALANANVAVGDVVDAASLLPQAFLPLVVVGSRFLPRLTDGLSDLTLRFTTFMLEAERSGRLAEFIQGGIDSVARLRDGLMQAGDIARNVIAGMRDLFADAELPVSNMADALEDISEQFRAWAGTAEAQERVQQVLQFLSEVDWGQILAVAGALSAMSKVFTAMSGIQGAISAITSLVALGPVGWIILGVAAALAALAAGFILAYRNSEDFRSWVHDKLIPALQEAWTWFQEKILPALQEFAETTGKQIAEGWQAFMDALERNWPELEKLGNLIKEIAEKYFPLWWGFLAGIAAPLGGFFALLIVIVEVLGFLVGAFEAVRTKAGEVWHWIQEHWQQLLSILIGPFVPAVLFIQEKYETIKGAATSAKEWLVNKWNELVAFVQGLPGRVRAAASGMWDSIKEQAANAADWVRGKADDIVNAIKSIPDRIGNVGSQIASKVKSGLGAISGPVGELLGFDVGGVVPGPKGAPQLAVVHGGETVVPTHNPSAMAAMSTGFAPASGAMVFPADLRELIATVRGLGEILRAEVQRLISWLDRNVQNYLEWITHGIVALIQMQYVGAKNLLVYEDLSTNLAPGRGRFVPGYHSGGMIPGGPTSEMLALLQGGEEVLTRHDPRHRANLGTAGGAVARAQVTVGFERTGDPLLDAIIEGLRYRVRTDGGGDVQVALGQVA